MNDITLAKLKKEFTPEELRPHEDDLYVATDTGVVLKTNKDIKAPAANHEQ